MKKIRFTLVLILLISLTIFQANSQVTTSPDSVCVGSNGVVYFVNGSTGSSFNWTVTGAGHTINSNGNNSITVDWSTTPGTDTLSVVETNVYGCIGDPVYLPVLRLPLPTANAGPDGLICEGNTFTINSATATNYSNLLWITSGTGNFTNNGTLSPTYTPSVADISAGSVTLILTASGYTPCGNASDSLVLTITPLPLADAGQDDIICEGNTYTISTASASNYSAINWTSSGTGAFANNGTLTPIYTPSAADIAAGSVVLTLTSYGNNPCGNDVDDLTLTITPLPLADAGQDDIICEGNSYSISTAAATNYNSLNWTTSGSGTFTNNGTLTPTYAPSTADIAAGSVVLTLTVYGNNPCGNDVDDLTLTITPLPLANAGQDDIICEGNTLSISGASSSNYNSLAWTTSGSGTFANNGTLTPTYTPSAADIASGSVVLTLTAYGNNPCGNAVDDMTLTIIPMVTVDAGQNGTICEGNTFTVNSAVATNYNNLLWSTSGTGTFANGNTLTPTYIPSAADIAAGNVILTLTANGNSPCGNVSDNITLNIIPAPVANAGPDITICEGAVVTITGATAINYTTLIWATSGSGTFTNNSTLNPTYTPSAADINAGTVTLTLTVNGYSPCNPVTDDMVITIHPKPVTSAIFHF
ncbi:hypothetical protein ACFL6I_24820 [candidate division KSB1 bacterium]